MNRSNFVHGAYALAFQLAVGLAPLLIWKAALPLIVAGAGVVCFFVGVEWMQEIRIKLQERGIQWPAPVGLKLALEGFMGWGRDRYFDIGVPLLACLATDVAAVYWVN